ncbi:MAG: AIR synthase-related protein, partial [bacterium]|nr:AIR synthase-related protein [bacterium]
MGNRDACTDISEFGLLGHLREMAASSGFGTRVNWNAVPVLDAVWEMVRQDCIPDGTQNN